MTTPDDDRLIGRGDGSASRSDDEPADPPTEDDPPADPPTDPGDPLPEAPPAAADPHPYRPKPAEKDGRYAATFKEWWSGKPIPPLPALFFGFVLPAMILVGYMWRTHPFTIDDSFISFRYAKNLANGLGLVYNDGARIEGYTNFLWTVLLAAGYKVGFDIEPLAKVLGAASAIGALYVVYLLSGEIRAYRTMPSVATWLLASSIVFSGYAVLGLETLLLVFLFVLGIYLFLRETGGVMRGPRARADAPEPTAFPWSGLAFALAALTRPEPPLFYVTVLLPFLGWKAFVGRQNRIRLALVYVPVAAHYAFRLAYYHALFPNTASAKTGNLGGQLVVGKNYIFSYFTQQGVSLWFAVLGLAIGIVLRRRDILAIGVLAISIVGYVAMVGGDWMPFFRFMAPFEPLCFVLVDIGVRYVVDRREPAANLALAVLGVALVPMRHAAIHEAQDSFIGKEKHFWDKAAGGTADWFLKNGERGEIGIGDIGYVGYKTDYPVLDLLGLVDPAISKMEGGYTRKIGADFRDYFFKVGPKYVIIISSNNDCTHPSVAGSQVLYRDARFAPAYDLAGRVPLDGGFNWCIYKNKSVGPNELRAAPAR